MGKIFQPNQTDEALPCSYNVGLLLIANLIVVKRWPGIEKHYAFPLPKFKRIGRACVPVIVLIVARLTLPQDQSDNVIGVTVVVHLLFLWRNHVKRWRDHLSHISDQFLIVEQPLEGCNFGHIALSPMMANPKTKNFTLAARPSLSNNGANAISDCRF
jgi:hypothetical protein